MLKHLIMSLSLLVALSSDATNTIPFEKLRSLWDMSHFPIDEIGRTDSPWLLIRVTPSADAGVTSGVEIDTNTGKLVNTGGAMLTQWKGLMTQMQRFDGKPLDAGQMSYAWGEPIHSKNVELAKVWFSPFQSGGVIISQFWANATNENQFEPCYFAGDSAYQFCTDYNVKAKDSGSALRQPSTAGERKLLMESLTGNNPLVSLKVFRLLKSTSVLKDDPSNFVPPTSLELIEMSPVSTRSLLFTDHLCNSSSPDVTVQEMRKHLLGMTSVSQIEPVIHAGSAVLHFSNSRQDAALQQSCRGLLDECSKAMKKLSGDETAKSQLEQIINF